MGGVGEVPIHCSNSPAGEREKKDFCDHTRSNTVDHTGQQVPLYPALTLTPKACAGLLETMLKGRS